MLGHAESVALAPSLVDCALAAIAAEVLENAATDAYPELRYLSRARDRILRDFPDWTTALGSSLSDPVAVDESLVRLERALGLRPIEVLAAALASAVEGDAMVGRALTRIQAPVGGSRPTIGLLAAVSADERPVESLVSGAAVRTGLLAVLGADLPVAERSLAMHLHLHLALHGFDGGVPGATIGLGDMPPVPLPPSVETGLRSHAGALAGDHHTLVVRTASPSEGRTVCSEIADRLGLRPLFIDDVPIAGLGPWLLLRRLIPVFCFELAPGERKRLPETPGYQGPVVALCGPDGAVESRGEPALSWLIPTPREEERRSLWLAAIGDPRLSEQLAGSHRQGCGRIAQLGRLARRQSLLHRREVPAMDDLLQAAWAGEGPGLETLAQPLRDPIPDEALVAGAHLRAGLRHLELRCRSRERLTESRGASLKARYRPGVRALLVGPSGTGKTLAAGWLATRLGLPLYQVDLAAINSKYIGETEKNLAQLLARAEHAEVILLFDEADSLFGKRTEVRDATDRFANSQTNYLLQRIETFDGIALLTSNSRARFDSAFTRRLDMIVEFSAPGPEERRLLWQSHLGPGHSLSMANINQLASTTDLCGGHIRNAVLMASVLADQQRRPIRFADVVEGLACEYRKLGRAMPLSLEDGKQ